MYLCVYKHIYSYDINIFLKKSATMLFHSNLEVLITTELPEAIQTETATSLKPK